MRKRRQIELFSISFLDLLSGALGAVIILYVAMPKSKIQVEPANSKVQMVNDLAMEELKKSDVENAKLKKQIEELTLKIAQTPVSVAARDGEAGGKNVDIGFKFKGKNVIFLIDTSYSMHDEDRMGQVKAGLKMLFTSLSPEFKMDIIQFPLGERMPFKTMWGDLKESTNFNKMDAIDFVYTMRPMGGTPTREALLFALRNYDTATDIVLLTDGIPTLHNSNQRDNIYDILNSVKEENSHKVQINCIGVGSDFNRDKTNDRYKFLSLLSEQNNGFFVGF